jgi:predicted DCC family thiol-disulfide oxidoreductase YuxK
MNVQNRPQNVIYDGNCQVCTTLKDFVINRDVADQLEFVPAQNVEFLETYPHLQAEEFEKSLYVIDAKGSYLRGARAVFEIMSTLPRMWGFTGKILKLPPFYWIAEPFYRAFAQHRHQFNKNSQKIT